VLLSEYLEQFNRTPEDMRPICLMLTFRDFREYNCIFDNLRSTRQDVRMSSRVLVTTRTGEVITLKDRNDKIKLDDHRIIRRPGAGTLIYDLGV